MRAQEVVEGALRRRNVTRNIVGLEDVEISRRVASSSSTCGAAWPRPTSKAASAACWDTAGGQMSSVSWILLTASDSASGMTMYPMRQLAIPYAFDSEGQ